MSLALGMERQGLIDGSGPRKYYFTKEPVCVQAKAGTAACFFFLAKKHQEAMIGPLLRASNHCSKNLSGRVRGD